MRSIQNALTVGFTVTLAALAAVGCSSKSDTKAAISATFASPSAPAGEYTITLTGAGAPITKSATVVAAEGADSGALEVQFANCTGECSEEEQADPGLLPGRYSLAIVTPNGVRLTAVDPASIVLGEGDNPFTLTFGLDPAVVAEAEARAEAEAARDAAAEALGRADDPETPEDEGTGALGQAEDAAAEADAAEANAEACDDAATADVVESCADRITALTGALETAAAACTAEARGDAADCNAAIDALEADVAELQASLDAALARCEEDEDCDEALAALRDDLAEAQTTIAALREELAAGGGGATTGALCLGVSGPDSYEIRVGGVVYTPVAPPDGVCSVGDYITGLAPGTVLVEVRSSGWNTASTNVVIEAGSTASANFVMTEEAPVGSMFFSPNSAAVATGGTWCFPEGAVRVGLPGNFVTVPADGYTVTSPTPAVATAAFTGGQWCVSGVAPGMVNLAVTTPGGTTGTFPVVVY